MAHSSSSNLFPFFFSNPPVGSLPLLKCSSLDHCNSYNSKTFKSFILNLFLCKNWKFFFRISQHNLFMFKTGTTVHIYIYIYFFFFFVQFWTILPKIFEHLRLYFFDPSVQRFFLCYSPSIQITQFIQQMITHHSCYTRESHIQHTIQSHITFNSSNAQGCMI